MKIIQSNQTRIIPNNSLPVCQRNLSFEKDGAKYYTPIALKTKTQSYSVNDMRDIALKFIDIFNQEQGYSLEKINNNRILFSKKIIDTHKSQDTTLGLLTQWIDKLHNHLAEKVADDLNINKENLKSYISLLYRTPKSQEILAGQFHEDGRTDTDKFHVQMILPLDATETGTLFIPYKHKEKFINTHEIDKKNSKGALSYHKNKIGIVEQTDPNKIFAMFRHKHEKGLVHAIPNHTTHIKNNVRRPLLAFEFFQEN